MSLWDDLFTSARGNAAKDTYNQAKNLSSSFGGVNNLGDVANTFGVQQFDLPGYQKSVKAAYQPQRGALATKLAQLNSSTAANLSGANATPGGQFAANTNNYANAFSNMESSESNEELSGIDKQMQQQDFLGNFLKGIKSSQDQFGMQKIGAEEQAGSQLSSSSPFDDILSTLLNVAKIPTGKDKNVLTSLVGG